MSIGFIADTGEIMGFSRARLSKSVRHEHSLSLALSESANPPEWIGRIFCLQTLRPRQRHEHDGWLFAGRLFLHVLLIWQPLLDVTRLDVERRGIVPAVFVCKFPSFLNASINPAVRI